MITQAMIDDVARFEALQNVVRTGLRASLTLNGFDLLARYLVGIPGRKNVIWFSGGFPLDVEPDVNDNDPNPTESVVRNDEEVRKTDNLLTRAQVAVYPVDARSNDRPVAEFRQPEHVEPDEYRRQHRGDDGHERDGVPAADGVRARDHVRHGRRHREARRM